MRNMKKAKIDFYYWGTQCPYNHSNRLVLERTEEELGLEVEYHDIGKDHAMASRLHLYSPTMAIFDSGLRWSGPITFDLIKAYTEGEVPTRSPYVVESQGKLVEGHLFPLDLDNACDSAGLCCPSWSKESALEKKAWLKGMMDVSKSEDLGVLHFQGETCVGGAEYLPSHLVPYDIPKSKEAAFLTCVYASDPEYDYKSHALNELEAKLRGRGYRAIYAVASIRVAFPNGPLQWFLDRGYEDLGLLYYEENDDALQHLVKKDL